MSHTSRLGFGMETAFASILEGIIEQSNAFDVDVVALSEEGWSGQLPMVYY